MYILVLRKTHLRTKQILPHVLQRKNFRGRFIKSPPRNNIATNYGRVDFLRLHISALSSHHDYRGDNHRGQRSPDWGQCDVSVCPLLTALWSAGGGGARRG